MSHLDIPTPGEWSCVLHELSEDNTLRIKLFKPYVKYERLWMTFYGVRYCDLPTRWQGAEFTLASQEECLALISKIRDISEQEKNHLQLYQVKCRSENKVVYGEILAEGSQLG